MAGMPVRERLLRSAAELFYENGIGATGIDMITAHAGVAKMSLYNNFESKAELVNAYIDARYAEWQEMCRRRMSRARSPRARILAVFDSYADHAARDYGRGFRGCGLFNAAAELAMGDPGRVSVARQKKEVERIFREELLALDPAGGNAAALAAEHLSYLLEGAMSRAGLDGHAARLTAARKVALSILKQVEEEAAARCGRRSRPAASLRPSRRKAAHGKS